MIFVIAQGYAVSFLANLALVEFLKIVVRKSVKGGRYSVNFRLLFEQRGREKRCSRDLCNLLLLFEFVGGVQPFYELPA